MMEWSTEKPEYIYLPGIANLILKSGTDVIFRLQHSRSDADYEIVLGAKTAKKIGDNVYNNRYAAEFGKFDFDEEHEESEEFEIAYSILYDIWERISVWSREK